MSMVVRSTTCKMTNTSSESSKSNQVRSLPSLRGCAGKGSDETPNMLPPGTNEYYPLQASAALQVFFFFFHSSQRGPQN